MTKYEVGDRVRFFGSEGCAPDTGTVISIDDDGTCWATWDSDGQNNCFCLGNTKFEKILESTEVEDLKARVARLEEIVAKLSHLSNRNIQF